MLGKVDWKRVVILPTLLAVVALAACAPAAAPPKPATLQKVDMGLAAVSPSMSIFQVTKETGIFQKYGLDVTLLPMGGGATATQALVGGSVQFAGVAGPNVVNSDFSGADVVLINSIADRFTDVLVTGKGITKAEDLKGKTIGVGQLGATPEFETRLALRALNLSDKDVKMLQSGGEPERVAALQANGIQAALVDASLSDTMKAAGFNILTSFLDSPTRYQFTGVAVTRTYLKQNRDTVKRFTQALTEGIKFFKANKAQTVDITAKWMKTEDNAPVEKAYDVYAKILQAKPYVSREGMQTVLDFIANAEPKAKTAKPEDFIDDSVIKDLDQSGFIDGLYK